MAWLKISVDLYLEKIDTDCSNAIVGELSRENEEEGRITSGQLKATDTRQEDASEAVLEVVICRGSVVEAERIK